MAAKIHHLLAIRHETVRRRDDGHDFIRAPSVSAGTAARPLIAAVAITGREIADALCLTSPPLVPSLTFRALMECPVANALGSDGMFRR